jgi:hypothetical protein
VWPRKLREHQTAFRPAATRNLQHRSSRTFEKRSSLASPSHAASASVPELQAPVPENSKGSRHYIGIAIVLVTVPMC